MSNGIERAVIHFFSNTALVFGAFWLVRVTQRRWPKHLPLGTAALLVFTGAALREAWDVAHGQPLWKAFTDYLSWFLGCAFSAWLLYRAMKWERF